jgi:hypothetical protein
MIGDVRGEIGFLAVLAHDHAVFLIPEFLRAKPQRAVFAIQVALALKTRERPLDGAAVCERALRSPVIELDAELRKVAPDVVQHRGERYLEHFAKSIAPQELTRAGDERIDMLLLVARGRIRRQPRRNLSGGPLEARALLREHRARDRLHVVALVAIRRKRELLGAQLEIAQPHAQCEDVHLPAGVVDVILALHAEADRSQQARERRAVRGLAAVTDVQRSGRIGGHELQEHAHTGARRAAPVARAFGMNARDLTRVGLLR